MFKASIMLWKVFVNLAHFSQPLTVYWIPTATSDFSLTRDTSKGQED